MITNKKILIGKIDFNLFEIDGNTGDIDKTNKLLQEKFGYNNIIDKDGKILIVFGSNGKSYEVEEVKDSYVSDVYCPLMENKEKEDGKTWGSTYQYDTFAIRKEYISNIKEVSPKELIQLMLK